jgi:hypothetical protein
MTPPITEELLTAALDYATRGWYVIPLHDVTQGYCSCGTPQCDAPSKHPRIYDWTSTASIDPAQIRHWWTQWPHANVGILTGERSGLAVLDVDPRNGGALALEDLTQSYGPLPDTPMVISGGKGPHHYFGLDGPLRKFDPGPGLNLQADGAQVVAPPSLHQSGNRYAWEASSHPEDMPLAPLPDWLRAMGEAKASALVQGVNLPQILPVVELYTLKVSPRIKYVILTGQDPDDPRHYPSRSEALFAAITALVDAGCDDATIAGVIMDKRYAISEKVWDQKNLKNPYYIEQTKAWGAGEIARARAKHSQLHISGQATPPDAFAVQAQGQPWGSSPWAKAIPVGDFLAQPDPTRPALAQDLVVPGAITLLAAPRGTGKSVTALALGIALASGGVFRGARLPSTRVLLVDRDNPPVVVRKRLGWLGATAGSTLDILTRDDAPSLKEKTAWANFPVDQYDVVLIDSLGAATEGVSEKEGRQTQEFLAILKDLAHRGPAILALDNTTKAATSYRGRGEKADAVDILYEARDITGWTPSTADAWWESLPEYGDHAWQQRATRRKGQKVLRIAFIPSKFRLGIEPEPFVLEIDTTTTPWALADITEHIATAGTRAAEETRRQGQAQIVQAEAKLIQAIATRAADAPLLKEEAVTLLQGYGLTRKAARTLLESGGNHDVYPQGQWIIRPIPGHPSGKALGVYPAREENDGGRSKVIPFPRQYMLPNPPPSAVGSGLDGERLVPISSSNQAAPNGADLSPQLSDRTAEGVTPPEKQPCGNSEAGRPSAVPTLSDGPLSTFKDFTAAFLWCSTCGATVSFRTLPQLDGTEVYLCNACGTEVGRKHTTAPPSPNGTQAPNDAPPEGQLSSGDGEDEFGDIPF